MLTPALRRRCISGTLFDLGPIVAMIELCQGSAVPTYVLRMYELLNSNLTGFICEYHSICDIYAFDSIVNEKRWKTTGRRRRSKHEIGQRTDHRPRETLDVQQIVCAAQRKCALQLCDSRRPTREVLRKCHTQHEHTRQCWRANPRAVPSTHGAQRERERAALIGLRKCGRQQALSRHVALSRRLAQPRSSRRRRRTTAPRRDVARKRRRRRWRHAAALEEQRKPAARRQ